MFSFEIQDIDVFVIKGYDIYDRGESRKMVKEKRRML